jgi:RimJ/RimL family protein N-acetyltransferase
MTALDEATNAPRRNFWRGERIRLRAVEERDLDALLKPTGEYDTELDRYEDAVGFPLSPERERDNLRKLVRRVGKDDFLFLYIEDLEGNVVGHINSFDCSRRNRTFKYALAIEQPFWRRGYGREAVMIFLRFFFRELGYQKCTALVYSFNERSIRFHEGIGFRFEGRLRNMVFSNGEYFDELYFGITRAEWDQIDPPVRLGRFSAHDETTFPTAN